MTFARVLLMVVLCAFAPLWAWAQTTTTWQQLVDELLRDDEAGEAYTEADYEWLQQLADHPLELNSATREELEQLPFLSAQQVMDFMEYRDRYGPLRSMGELRMVRSMDYLQLALLPCFTYVGEVAAPKERFPSLSTIMEYGRHDLTATLRQPFYQRQGDKNGYLGYNLRHSLRYDFSYGNHVRAGFVGAQDASEPFFAGRNKWGYDAYSYYFQLKASGPLRQLVVGKYKFAVGMGLVANTGFSLGKQMTLQHLGRSTTTLRPHASRSETDYFQGIAATVAPARHLMLTAFASWRPIDATLSADSTATTLITSGYHRTPTEMDKKYNTHIAVAGTALAYDHQGWHVGLNGVLSHLDRSLEPNRKTLYRRHYAHGCHFANASIDYGWTRHALSLRGETALNQQGALATINTVSLQPSGRLSLVAVQRFYSYRYTSLYAHSFSEYGHVQNESGFYLGINYQPLSHLHLQAYADFAYAPWARYQVSLSSRAWDFFTQATYQRQHWTLQARYRLRLRQKDNEAHTALNDYTLHRARLSASYAWTVPLTLKTQLDATHSSTRSTGWMLSEQLAWHPQRWQLGLTAALFHTDDYQSRLYLYERPLQHEFAFTSFYGEGFRLLLFASTDVGQHLRLSARLGHTDYFDRSTIGSGLQLINGSTQTDADVQVRWRF